MSNLTQSILMWAAPCVLVLLGFVLAICGGAMYEENDGRNSGGAGTLEATGWAFFGIGVVWIAWCLAASFA